MGANAQTTVPTFTAGQVLTAAQMNNSARTGVPVFANTSARDAGFGGTGEKTLAEGQLCYLEDSDVVQYYDGSSWGSVGATALTLVSDTTIGTAVASHAVTNCFSATYDSYLLTVTGGVDSGNNNITLIFGATVTGYYGAQLTVNTGGTVSGFGDSNAASFTRFATGSTAGYSIWATIQSPFAATRTQVNSLYQSGGLRVYNGELQNTTSYTGFTIAAASGTLTGGIVRVYGMGN